MTNDELLVLSTIPIHMFKNDDTIPSCNGSGCFVKYKKQFLFLTVFHNCNESDLKARIVYDYNEKSGTKTLPLPSPGHLKVGNIYSSTFHDVDFAFFNYKKKFPKCYHVCLNESGEIIGKIKRRYLSSNLSSVPNKEEEYSFTGYTYGSREKSPYVKAKFQDIYKQEMPIYSGLKYKKSQDDYHFFSMPNKDYEFDDFRGTSGAPILDSQGNLVALVVQGVFSEDGKEFIIEGLNLQKYSISIDASLELIK